MHEMRRAVLAVADLMALAARTAPKGKGVDTIILKIISGDELNLLASHLESLGREHKIGFFLRDAQNIAASDACLIVGSKGAMMVGVNCGACGYASCDEFETACRGRARAPARFSGPNCAIRMTDLGIAVGSAVKTAQIHNVDNRIMYSGGVAAVDLGLLGGECTVAYAIPLAATGKNIFFDRIVVRQ
ncbi:ferredoxin domain-containing protein [Methanoregula sp.]|uniref:ferredoxin domain-containing protein n=1 Tax=Methanoregula sp. TaxID=2052170 RepID=UPI00356951D9